MTENEALITIKNPDSDMVLAILAGSVEFREHPNPQDNPDFKDIEQLPISINRKFVNGKYIYWLAGPGNSQHIIRKAIQINLEIGGN